MDEKIFTVEEEFVSSILYCNQHLNEDEIDQMIAQCFNLPFVGSDDESIKDPILEVAQKAFGINYLYPWQRLVIANILDNSDSEKNCTQQIVLLPTGAGKSMCFLVPALVFSGATLILYPLLALMQDQERRMTEGALSSVTFRGGQTPEQRSENLQKIKDGRAKVILANPEVLQNKNLIAELKQCNISHIAIDEAHCVSEWGDSFRPAYLTLGKIIKELEVPKVTAFTATASPTVLDRVNEVLFDGNGHIVRSEADRPNIHYYVEYAHIKEKAVLHLALQEQRPLLIFCGTRKNAERMAHLLKEQERFLQFSKKDDTKNGAKQESGQNIDELDNIRFYHAGLSKEEKTETEKWFYPHKNAIMACTCAFGMGVDKKDIKTVIHLDVPQTAESFIQEAGRGGRDGSIAKSILVWSPTDSKIFRRYRDDSRQHVLFDFAETRNCRRQVLLDALGAEKAACKGCDNCLGLSNFEETENSHVIKFIAKNNNCYTANETAIMLENKSLSSPSAISDKEYKRIFINLYKKRKIILRPHLRLRRQKQVFRLRQALAKLFSFGR